MTKDELRRPKVGMGVIILKDGKLLMQRRKGAHGAGTWSLPGGHLEWFETWEDGARREVIEEIGIEVTNVRLVGTTNDIMEDEDKHYITLFLSADWAAGEPEVKEPEFCDEIGWFVWEEMPSPRFLPFENFLKSGWRPDMKE